MYRDRGRDNTDSLDTVTVDRLIFQEVIPTDYQRVELKKKLNVFCGLDNFI